MNTDPISPRGSIFGEFGDDGTWVFRYGPNDSVDIMIYSRDHDASYLVLPNSLGWKTVMKWVDGVMLEGEQKLLDLDDTPYPW